MKKRRWMGGALVVAMSGVLLAPSAPALATAPSATLAANSSATSSATLAANSSATSSATLAATRAANVTCATRVVAQWSLTRVARETVVVSAQASSLASLRAGAAQGYGGFLLFGASAPAGLPDTLRSLGGLEPDHVSPLIMSDDEGGGVIRFSNLVGTWPWAHDMGATMSPARITQVGRQVGVAMTRAGLNVDLAPVADVDGRAVWPGASNPDGLRSFGGSSLTDAADVVAFAAGLSAAHVVAVVKHFPGLGYASTNTDYGPATTQPWSVLRRGALAPFRAAINSGVNAVMLSNATVPGLTTLPASLSRVVVGELRHQLGFAGLIMTDALSAGAISARHLSVAQASVAALAAGVDQVLNGNPASPALALQTASLTTAAIVAAVERGSLTRARLVGAAAQVVAANPAFNCATGAAA